MDATETELRDTPGQRPLGEAMNPERVRAEVAARLLDGAAGRLGPCAVTFARGSGARALFHYQFTLAGLGGAEARPFPVTALSFGEERTREAWEWVLANKAEATEPVDGVRRVGYVPELDLLLQATPFDIRMPVLERILAGPDAELVEPLQERFGPGHRLVAWRGELTRYRVALRGTVLLTVDAEAPGGGVVVRRFYAKAYGEPEVAERSARIVRELEAALAGHAGELAIAGLAADHPDARLLVLDEVPGEDMTTLLQRAQARGDRQAAEAAARRAARALAELHQLPIEVPPDHHQVPRGSEERVRQMAALAGRRRPDLAPLAEEVAERVLDALAALPPLAAPTHGDLKPAHLLLGDERVVVLDFDKCVLGDPLLDVAAMLARFRRGKRGGRRNLLASLGEGFAEEYLRHVPAAWADRLVPVYAETLLRQASGLDSAVRERRQSATTSDRAAVVDEVTQMLGEARDAMATGAIWREGRRRP